MCVCVCVCMCLRAFLWVCVCGHARACVCARVRLCSITCVYVTEDVNVFIIFMWNRSKYISVYGCTGVLQWLLNV